MDFPFLYNITISGQTYQFILWINYYRILLYNLCLVFHPILQVLLEPYSWYRAHCAHILKLWRKELKKGIRRWLAWGRITYISTQKISRKWKPTLILKAIMIIYSVTRWFGITQFGDKKVMTITNLIKTMWISRYLCPIKIMYYWG